MRISSLEEKEIIGAIKDFFPSQEKELLTGIGDDAAVAKIGEKNIIFTKDILLEDVHFKLSFHPSHLLGRKSLSANLSDIAAMGGTPKYALFGLGIPEKIELFWLEDFMEGLKSVAQEEKVTLAGGDVSRSKKITISITVIGVGKNIIRRSGGQPGDIVCVSGTLGDAKEGLLLLQKGFKIGDDREADFVLKRFLDPFPQVSLGKELSHRQLASAMIDLSDGLSVDLSHLCEESGCGGIIYRDKLPLSSSLRALQRKCYDFALHGGEDYQLLFSIPKKRVKELAQLQKVYPVSHIGELIRGDRIYIADYTGRKKELKSKGYQHFKK